MATPPAPRPRPRNPETQARLRRDVLWQIYLPLGLAVLALLVVMGLTIFLAGLPTRSVWADVSIMYLIVFAVIGGVVVLVVLAGLCAALWYVLRELPGYFKMVQDFMRQVAAQMAEISQKVAGVFIAPRAYIAGAQKTVDRARSTITSGRKQ